MKILIASNYQPPHMGGIEFAVEALKECWQADGHAVTLLTTDIPGGARKSTPDNVRLPAWNIMEDWLQINTPWVYPWHHGEIARLVAAHDVVNTHSLSPSLAVLVMREAIRRGKPLVVTQHVGVIPHKIKCIGSVQHYFICREAKRAADAGAYLSFVSQAVREWFMQNAGIDGNRLAMTPAGINQNDYHFVDEREQREYRAKWNVLDEKMNVLFVGRFYDKKGLPLIRQIAERCPHIHFTLVGGGPINPRGWNLPNIRVIDFVSNKELRELYGSHDLFIMPSFGEGWPAVIPQAMICGTPCMISEECFEGYQKDRNQFLVVKRDAEIIAGELRTWNQNTVDRAMTSTYAKNTWNWMTTARIYLELFNRLGG